MNIVVYPTATRKKYLFSLFICLFIIIGNGVSNGLMHGKQGFFSRNCYRLTITTLELSATSFEKPDTQKGAINPELNIANNSYFTKLVPNLLLDIKVLEKPVHTGISPGLSNTEIGGIAFEDWDYDGEMNHNDTIGVAGVKVFIYEDCNNVVDSTFTDINGNYKFTGLTDGTTYRVEFSLPDSVANWANITQKGTDNGTAIQFVQPSNCAHLGLAAPNEYCEENPTLSTACYINGDMSRDGGIFQPGFYDVLVSYEYDESGKNGDAGYIPPNHLAVGGEIGVVWGLAYDKNLDDLYSASFLKRHTGFPTKDSLGVIWKTDNPMGTPINIPFVDLIGLGEDVGQSLVPNNRTLGQFTGDPSQDSVVFHLIGKVGLGDLEISDDFQTLYVVNLYQKEVLEISINLGTISNRYSIPDMNCNKGETRPFALKYHRGTLYAGAVCTGENAGTNADLQASVFELVGSNFIEIANTSLDYDRDWASAGTNADWQPWINSWIWGSSPIAYPQPLLSDIEFDVDGSLILGFMDRTGHQTGSNNYHIDGTGIWSATSGGEILRLCNINGSYVTEGTGACAYNVSPLPLRGTGGEYYHGEEFTGGSHYETALGGLAMLNGTGEVVTTGYSPLAFNTGGIYWLDNETGASNKRYELFDGSAPGNFGKSSGLGDVEIMCTATAPLEIGNYVWYDQDGDGIQDACEPGIPGVQIFLRSSTGATLDTYVSDANGQYYFGESASGYTLEPNTSYYLVFGLFGGFDRATQLLFDSLKLTQPNVIAGTMPDEIDSDAIISSSGVPSQVLDYPHIQVTTGDAGSINHSLDVGFFQPCKITTSIIAMSECTVVGGNAEVDVTFRVDWAQSGNIELKMNGLTQVIDVQNGAISPDTITYTIPADLAQNTFLGYNLDDSTCGDTLTFIAPPACIDCTVGTNIIGGNAFADYNLNGIADDGGAAKSGVKVYVYGCDVDGNSEVIDSAITDFYGDYVFDTNITDGESYRVEFVLPDSLNFLQTGFNGANSNTSVQFVTSPNCSVDVGFAAPTDYCQAIPQIVTTCFVTQEYNGDYLDSAALVTFPFDATGDASNAGYIYPTVLATHGQIGATYGLAYHQDSDAYFVAAFLKRAAGFGPNGPGAIYKVDQTGTITLHTDLNALFPGAAGVDPHDFSGDPGSISYDNASTSLVGKLSLGDMELSVDGQFLHVVNLNDKKLYTIPINVTPTVGNVTSVDLPIPGDCPASSYNPFGLGIGPDGAVYVGAVCSSASTTAGLEAYVYRYDGVGTFINVLQYDLDFLREVKEWSSWTNSPNTSSSPTPIFSDIEFDGNRMIMGIRDRRGDQFYATSPSVLGDVYTASWNGQNWILEDNAFTGSTLGTDINQNNGPGGGKFYDVTDGIGVDAAGMGGLLQIPGRDLVTTLMDPYRAVSAGVAYLGDNGAQTNLYEVYQIPGSLPVPLFGKANGLGDLQARCEAAPIEIGNYVWLDENGDGIQDPCEMALSGINITLYDFNGDSVTTVQTDAKGEYYFNENLAAIDSLAKDSMYFIVIGKGGQFDVTTANLVDTLTLTVDNTGMGTQPNLNDSDGEIANNIDPDFDGLPFVKVTIGSQTDHSYDFGFKPAFEPLPCDCPSTYSLCWDQSGFVEPPNDDLSNFPYSDTMTNISGSGIDLTVTLFQPARDQPADPDPQQSYISPGSRCGCTFDDELTPYLSCGETFRNWSRQEPTPDTVIMTFSEPIKLPVWGFGGFKTNQGNIESAIASFTFYDGPNATGNKIVSTLPNPGGRAQINTGDPLLAAINELQDKGAQETELYNGTYYYEGQNNTRGWTILDMGDAVFQSIMVIQYTVEDDLSPVDYVPITPASANNSGYWASFDYQTCACKDYGDLPDLANGTTNHMDYETYDSTGGPSHVIIDGLFLGDTVDIDNDGVPDGNALGDDNDGLIDDEDGVNIFPSLNIIPGGTIKLPITMTNTTGELAYLEAWIDWNGDGDFDDPNEMVENIDNIGNGIFSNTMIINVPTDAVTNTLVGFRVRYSNTDDMTPYGRVNSGEVEDYLIGIDCPQVNCLPFEFELKKE